MCIFNVAHWDNQEKMILKLVIRIAIFFYQNYKGALLN